MTQIKVKWRVQEYRGQPALQADYQGHRLVQTAGCDEADRPFKGYVGWVDDEQVIRARRKGEVYFWFHRYLHVVPGQVSLDYC